MNCRASEHENPSLEEDPTWSIVQGSFERVSHGIDQLIGELEHITILRKRHFELLGFVKIG